MRFRSRLRGRAATAAEEPTTPEAPKAPEPPKPPKRPDGPISVRSTGEAALYWLGYQDSPTRFLDLPERVTEVRYAFGLPGDDGNTVAHVGRGLHGDFTPENVRKARERGVRVVLSIGGAHGARMTMADPQATAASVVRAAEDLGIGYWDGLDFDMEKAGGPTGAQCAAVVDALRNRWGAAFQASCAPGGAAVSEYYDSILPALLEQNRLSMFGHQMYEWGDWLGGRRIDLGDFRAAWDRAFRAGCPADKFAPLYMPQGTMAPNNYNTPEEVREFFRWVRTKGGRHGGVWVAGLPGANEMIEAIADQLG